MQKDVSTWKKNCVYYDIHGGHPQKLYRSLEDGAGEINYDYLHRFLAPTLVSTGVQNTGTTQGYTLIESHPEMVGSKYQKAANFSLVFGLFFIVSGFFLSVTMNQIIYTMEMNMPIAGVILIGIGYDFFDKSKKLSDIVRFKSKIILSDLKGEYYKSDLGVGTGVDDSLSSQRVSVISDNRLSHYSAEVLSECYKFEGYRELIAINNSEEIDNDVKSLVKFVESQRKPDLEVQGIDFGQESAKKLLQQNVAIAKIKAQELGQLPQSLEMKDINIIDNLESGKGEDDEIYVICSNCNKKNKGAKFCMNCGTKL
jgi:hypothetical protein